MNIAKMMLSAVIVAVLMAGCAFADIFVFAATDAARLTDMKTDNNLRGKV